MAAPAARMPATVMSSTHVDDAAGGVQAGAASGVALSPPPPHPTSAERTKIFRIVGDLTRFLAPAWSRSYRRRSMDRRWLYRIAGAALLVALLVYLPHLVHSSDGYVRMTRMHDELEELDRRRESLARENAELRRDIKRLRGDLDAIDR